MIKIALVDDNRQTLHSLKEMLNYSQAVEIVFTAINGKEFIKQMDELNRVEQPAVVLIDIDMPEMDGIQTISIGKLKYPFTKYLVLTVFDDEDRLFECIKAGANGYLLKDEKINVIIEHVKNLINHESTPMSPAIAKKAFNLLSKMSKPESKKNEILEELTNREIDVMLLMTEGNNYKVIAEKLFISPNTVKKHIAHIYEKLHVSSKAQIINLVNKG